MEPSGAQWCARYPASAAIPDLTEPFRTFAAAFIEALRDAGAAVTVNSTWRPPERAYLMHFCCLAAGYRDEQKIFHQLAPADIPPMAGVDIDWTHDGDVGAAIAAAVAMRQAYDIAYPAALVSNHTRRLAVDMTIQFKGIISVRDARGQMRPAACQSDLWPIGASYSVFKLPTDEPHWSVDGH